jgi:hypothetical protein
MTTNIAHAYGIHTPERHPLESMEQYRARRRASKTAARRAMAVGLNGGINSRRQLRDDMRTSGTMGQRTRAYVALVAAWASKRETNWKGPRDEHGAYTCVGSMYAVIGMRPDESSEHVFEAGQDDGEPFYTARRKWLAGISAQRGY